MTKAPRSRLARLVAFCALAIFACDAGPGPTSREALENGTYLTPTGTVTLQDGEAAAEAPGGLRYVLSAHAEGDLDLDGAPDAAVVTAEEDGTQRLYRLHAVLSDGEEVQDVSARLIGDRIELRRLSIEDGLIRTEVLARKPGEPVTVDPSMSITAYYALTRRGLVAVSPRALSGVVPRDSVDATTPLPTDRAGTVLSEYEWRLTAIRMGEWTGDISVLEEAPTLRFMPELAGPGEASGQIAGATGCNRFFGSFRATEASEIRFSGLGATRRACPDPAGDFEQRLLAAFGSAEAYALADDDLEITFLGGSMRFRAAGRIAPAEVGGTPEPGRAGDAAAPRGRTT